MATRYVWSGASGAGTGADWDNAHTTRIAAITASVAGDTFVVASDHIEMLSTNAVHKGTHSAIDTIFTVNRTTGLPERMEVGGGYYGSASGVGISLRGSFVEYGAFYKVAGGYSGTVAANLNLCNTTNDRQTYVDISIELPNANSCRITGGGGAMLEVNNPRVVNCRDNAAWGTGGSVLVRGAGLGPMWPKVMTGGIVGALNGFIDFDGVDWGNQNGGKLYVSNTTSVTQHVRIRNSAIHSSMIFTVLAGRCQRADIINCTDEAGNIRMERHWYEGAQTLVRASANPSAVRTGGAADSVGAFAWKIVTTDKANRNMPFETLDLGFPVPSAKVGVSTTISFHTITDNVTLTDADARLLLGGAVTSNSALLTYINDGPADPLATPTNQAGSTETWSTSGITTAAKQKLEGTITPARVGPHEAIIQVGRPSTTMFVCPEPTIT